MKIDKDFARNKKAVFTYFDNRSKEIYTNGTILVPLFRVLDAIEQKGNQYQTFGGNNE